MLKKLQIKEPKHDRFGKRPAATETQDIDDRSTEAHGNALRRSIKLFFFFLFLRSSNNLRFAFLALKIASQAFTLKISICSANINHALRCWLHAELATGRACLWTADPGAASQLQLTEPKEQRVAQRRPRAQAGKSELKSLPGPAILLDVIPRKNRCQLKRYSTEGCFFPVICPTIQRSLLIYSHCSFSCRSLLCLVPVHPGCLFRLLLSLLSPSSRPPNRPCHSEPYP